MLFFINKKKTCIISYYTNKLIIPIQNLPHPTGRSPLPRPLPKKRKNYRLPMKRMTFGVWLTRKKKQKKKQKKKKKKKKQKKIYHIVKRDLAANR